MIFFLRLIKKLFHIKKVVIDKADEALWEHLDGAEFFAVFPKPQAKTTAD